MPAAGVAVSAAAAGRAAASAASAARLARGVARGARSARGSRGSRSSTRAGRAAAAGRSSVSRSSERARSLRQRQLASRIDKSERTLRALQRDAPKDFNRTLKEKNVDLSDIADVLEDAVSLDDPRVQAALNQLEAVNEQYKYLQKLGLNPETQVNKFVSYGSRGQGVGKIKFDFWLEDVQVRYRSTKFSNIRETKTYSYTQTNRFFSPTTSIGYFVQQSGLTRYLNRVKNQRTSRTLADRDRKRQMQVNRKLNRKFGSIRRRLDKSREGHKNFLRLERQAFQRAGKSQTLGDKIVAQRRAQAQRDNRTIRRVLGLSVGRRTGR